MLSLYRKLLRVRRASKALTHGDYAAVRDVPDGFYAYTRQHEGERALTVLNFTNDRIVFDLPDAMQPVETLAGTHGEPAAAAHIELAANEGRVMRLA